MSERTESKLRRILSMLPWVIAHPGTPVAEVCRRFGYSERELLRDLDLVFMCGLPGYGPGDLMVAMVDEDGGVVVDMADYFDGAPRLTPAEALALLASALTILSSGHGTPELESAVQKLERTLAPGEEPALSIQVAPESEFLGLLRSAAAAGEVVDITYTSLSRGETRAREIEPWTVFTALGNWYVSAMCRSAGEERVFRVDRIRDAALTGERFQQPPELPPAEVRYTPNEDDVRVTIDLDAGARWVAEYYPVEVLSNGPDGMRVRFSASDASVAAGLLLRLGPHAAIVEGEEVRAALQSLRKRILDRYEKPQETSFS